MLVMLRPDPSGGLQASLEMIAALHSAARRYCIEHYAIWAKRYAEMGPRPAGPISERRYAVFPRYNVLGAILEGLERYTPEDFPTLRAARVALATVADTATNVMTRSDHPIAEQAMAEEREACRQFILDTPEEVLTSEPLLPYRRVLLD